MKDTYCEV